MQPDGDILFIKAAMPLLSHESSQYHRPGQTRGIKSKKKRASIAWSSLAKKWRWPTLPQIFAVPSAQTDKGGLKAKKREPQLLEALYPKSSDSTTLPQIFAVPSAQTDKGGLTAKKRASVFQLKLFSKKWRWPTLPQIFAVPSALTGLTSLFGMGRGGSPTLSIALISVPFIYLIHIVRKRIYSFTSYFRKQPHSATRKREAEHWMYAPEGSHTGKNSCAERKVFGQLVLLDWTCYHACICSLSTS